MEDPGTAGTVRGLADRERIDVTKDISPRLPILRVGTVTANAAGHAHLEGWQFDTRLSDGHQMDAEVVGDTLAGWPVGDLHVIAHGAPCETAGCPLA